MIISRKIKPSDIDILSYKIAFRHWYGRYLAILFWMVRDYETASSRPLLTSSTRLYITVRHISCAVASPDLHLMTSPNRTWRVVTCDRYTYSVRSSLLNLILHGSRGILLLFGYDILYTVYSKRWLRIPFTSTSALHHIKSSLNKSDHGHNIKELQR